MFKLARKSMMPLSRKPGVPLSYGGRDAAAGRGSDGQSCWILSAGLQEGGGNCTGIEIGDLLRRLGRGMEGSAGTEGSETLVCDAHWRVRNQGNGGGSGEGRRGSMHSTARSGSD